MFDINISVQFDDGVMIPTVQDSSRLYPSRPYSLNVCSHLDTWCLSSGLITVG